MKSSSVIYYIIALILPVVLFVGLLENYNERQPIVVWVVTLILFAGAGYLSSKDRDKKSAMQWIGWSVFIGVVESLLLTLAY